MGKKVIVFGGSGFLGSHVADVLSEKGFEVTLFDRVKSTWAKPTQKMIIGDIRDFDPVNEAIKGNEIVYHFAGLADLDDATTKPIETISKNIMGTANLLEAVRSADLTSYIQLCSTSEVYGQVNPEDVPITEDCPMRPSSPYAVSKTTQDNLGLTYWRCYGLPIIRTRMFAYFNPRRTDLFATSFARQVALIEAGKQQELLHGNLDSVRTMIDVRDAMRSYWDAVVHGIPGEVYNIGGPKSIRVGDFLDVLKKMAKTEIPSRVDPNLLRPADVTLQIPEISKFVLATGWKARYSFEESVEHLLNYWRARV